MQHHHRNDPNIDIDGNTPREVLVRLHPDGALLREQYRAFINRIDGRFGQYWLAAGADDERLRLVARRMAVSRAGALSGEVQPELIERFADTDSLDRFMIQHRLRAFGVFELMAEAVAEQPVRFMKSADSDELARFMNAYRTAMEDRAAGRQLSDKQTYWLGRYFADFLIEAGRRLDLR